MALELTVFTKSKTRSKDLINKIESLGILFREDYHVIDEGNRAIRIWNGGLRGYYSPYPDSLAEQDGNNLIKIKNIMAVKTAQELYDLITALD